MLIRSQPTRELRSEYAEHRCAMRSSRQWAMFPAPEWVCTPLCLITENNLDPEKQIRQPGCVSAPESYFLSVTVITCAVVLLFRCLRSLCPAVSSHAHTFIFLMPQTRLYCQWSISLRACVCVCVCSQFSSLIFSYSSASAHFLDSSVSASWPRYLWVFERNLLKYSVYLVMFGINFFGNGDQDFGSKNIL